MIKMTMGLVVWCVENRRSGNAAILTHFRISIHAEWFARGERWSNFYDLYETQFLREEQAIMRRKIVFKNWRVVPV